VVTASVPAGAALPDDGTVITDFNRAVNLPFRLHRVRHLPGAGAGNDLPIAVTAGELAPVRVTGPAAR